MLDAVEGANSSRVLFGDTFEGRLADNVGLFDAEGVKGFAVSFSLTELNRSSTDFSLFPLRVDTGEIESILRDRTLFLEVDYIINSDPNLSASKISILLVNGEALPEWLRVDDQGRLISGEPPIGEENVQLRIQITLSDETVIVRYVDVNVNSGEIASLDIIGDELIAGVSLFENQVEKEAIKFDESANNIAKTFID